MTDYPVGGSLRTASQESEHVRPGELSEQELLNRLAAIQAAAEILDDNQDLSPSERRLFVLVIRTETTRLHRRSPDDGLIEAEPAPQSP